MVMSVFSIRQQFKNRRTWLDLDAKTHCKAFAIHYDTGDHLQLAIL